MTKIILVLNIFIEFIVMKRTPPISKSFVIVNPTATVKGHSQSNNHSQSNPRLLFPVANLGSLAHVIFHIQSSSEQRRFPPPSAVNTGLRSEVEHHHSWK